MKNISRFGMVIALGAMVSGLVGCNGMPTATNAYGEQRGFLDMAGEFTGITKSQGEVVPQGSSESRWIAEQNGGNNPENPANDGLCSAEAVRLNGQRQPLVKERQGMTSENPQYAQVTQQVRDLTGKIRDAQVNFLDRLLNEQTALRTSLEARRTTEIDPSIDEQIATATRRINYLTGLRTDSEAIPSTYTALTMNPARIAQAVRANGGAGALSSAN